MADLISLSMLTNRLGPNVSVDDTQATEYIQDASAQARKIARGELDDVDDDNITEQYPELIGVIVSCVRRSLVNPDSFGSEMLDGYRSEQMPRDGVFLSKQEKRQIRDAVGLDSGVVTLVSPYSGDSEESL